MTTWFLIGLAFFILFVGVRITISWGGKMKINNLGTEPELSKAMEKLRKTPLTRLEDVSLIRSGSWVYGASKSADGANIFSARLLTPGSSTDTDWIILGLATDLYGVPKTVRPPATIETSPNATHYWVWK